MANPNANADKVTVMISSCGLVSISVLYVAGLIACILAGATGPDVFRTKTSILETSSGISSASSDFIFDISDYQRPHQSIFLKTRTNIPNELNHVIEAQGASDSSLEATNIYNVTVYGSPQSKILSATCPSGCTSCPDGKEEIGLTCHALATDARRVEDFTCESDVEWCSWVPLYEVDFVTYSTYYWVIDSSSELDTLVEGAETDPAWLHEFRVVYVSQWWTGFEMTWYYFWICAALLAMFLPGVGFFAVALRKGVPLRRWTRQQKWIGALLVALLFFNNPFFAAQIYSPHPKGFFVWYAIAGGVVVFLLLMFWMERLFDLGRGPDGGGRRKETLARAAMWTLSMIIFICYVITTIEMRVSDGGDPADVHSYPSSFTAGEKLLASLCFVYCSWILSLAYRVWWSESGRNVFRGSGRVIFSLVASSLTLLIVVPSIILESFSPRVQGALAFCVAHGAINMYILLMVLCCTPPQANLDDASERGMEPPGPVVAGPGLAPMEGAELGASGPVVDNRGSVTSKAQPNVADSSAWEDVLPDPV